MNMEALFELILLVISLQIMASECQYDIEGANFFDDESYLSSAQFNDMLEQNTLKNYWRSFQRSEHITGFICACALIREANNKEFKKATIVFPGYTCKNTWTKYYKQSSSPVAKKLKGSDFVPGLLLPQEYDAFSSSLCAAYFVCSKHIHCDTRTVQILNQLRAGTTKTIVQILRDEEPRFLLSTNDMKYINIFSKAVGENPFPFIKFNTTETEYAIPKVRNATDRLICPAFFRRPSLGTQMRV